MAKWAIVWAIFVRIVSVLREWCPNKWYRRLKIPNVDRVLCRRHEQDRNFEGTKLNTSKKEKKNIGINYRLLLLILESCSSCVFFSFSFNKSIPRWFWLFILNVARCRMLERISVFSVYSKTNGHRPSKNSNPNHIIFHITQTMK